MKCIQGMKAEGIRIGAVTVRSEPLHPGNNPSLLMQAREQAAFVKGHLGPAFRRAGLDTTIVIDDHKCDRPDYPISILDDREVRKYLDGSAFHLYAGNAGAMSSLHDARLDKNLYFTEQWIGAPGHLGGDLAWHPRELTVGATRSWSRTVTTQGTGIWPDKYSPRNKAIDAARARDRPDLRGSYRRQHPGPRGLLSRSISSKATL